MEIGNSFGMIAVVALSWLLIPVSTKQQSSPISRLFQWENPILILQYFHIWSGRICIGGGVLHGIFHTLRLGLQSPAVMWSYVFPPMQCWTHPQSFDPPICEGGKDECSCYQHFRVFTGWVAGIGLLFVALLSLYVVRRRWYATFALSHYVLTPLTFVMICIHYNKTILYASGSLLYYLACSYPIWMQWIQKRWIVCRHHPSSSTKILSIERIAADPCQAHRPCVVVTFAATQVATHAFQPGQYGYLLVPSLSQVAHPFTVNTVPSTTVTTNKQQRNCHSSTNADQIRIIFRVTGRFTRALERALFQDLNDNETSLFPRISTETRQMNGAEEDDVDDTEAGNDDADTHSTVPLVSPLPEMFLTGYAGGSSAGLLERISRHGVNVIVAAGIGITPYLGLISYFVNAPSKHDSSVDGIFNDSTLADSTMEKKKLILHWSCRDKALIEYCQREYMKQDAVTNTNGNASNVSIEIHIHHTGTARDSLFTDDENNNNNNNNNDDGAPNDPGTASKELVLDTSSFSAGVAFDLSNYGIRNDSLCQNLGFVTVFCLLAWGGLWLLWRWYQEQEGDAFVGRLATVLVLTLYGLVVASAANLWWHFRSKGSKVGGWAPLAIQEEVSEDANSDDDEIEMATYGDAKEHGVLSSSNDASSNARGRALVQVRLVNGRPSLATLVEGLQGSCLHPALFCCVPTKAFRVCAIVTQLAIEDGEPLFQVEYKDPGFDNLYFDDGNIIDVVEDDEA